LVIPLGESSARSGGRAVVAGALIVACVVVFAYELTLRGAALDAFALRWGAVPRLIVAALGGDPRVPRVELLTLVTSQFLHAGFLHLAGNMVFLWVFGRAVEQRIGGPLFLLVYLAAGTLAGLAQCLVSASETTPLIGASGAIAAVLGMYFVAYPRAWVRVLLPVLFFFWTFDLPALVVLALWFGTQFFYGLATITSATQATGGVAVWAHVGGFVVGVLLGRLLPAAAGAMPAPGAAASSGRDAPGPARLVASAADLAALLLAVRVGVQYFDVLASRSSVAALGTPVLSVTEPVIGPLRGVLPTVRVMGGPLELASLVAIVGVYVAAGLVSQVFVRRA
jgi:membrane associated rhomboid family serine protease